MNHTLKSIGKNVKTTKMNMLKKAQQNLDIISEEMRKFRTDNKNVRKKMMEILKLKNTFEIKKSQM